MSFFTLDGRPTRDCPRCYGQVVTRSRVRNRLGRAFVRLFGLRIYRCADCWYRFVGRAWPS